MFTYSYTVVFIVEGKYDIKTGTEQRHEDSYSMWTPIDVMCDYQSVYCLKENRGLSNMLASLFLV